MREQAIYAENLDWTLINAEDFVSLHKALLNWRDANPNAAVLDIAYTDGYSYAGAQLVTSRRDYGSVSVLITLQRG